MYMVVKKGQLREHDSLNSAAIEADRLSIENFSSFYVIEVIAIAETMPRNHMAPWTRKLDEELLYLYMGGHWTPRKLAKHFGRSCHAICCRLERFKLCSEADSNYRGW